MKKIIFIAATLLIFCVFNYGIYQKEKIKFHGEIVYFKLAPFDPRSLMQGDYVQFSYVLANEKKCAGDKRNGYVVITVGENNIGTFSRCYRGGELAAKEKLLYYYRYYETIHIVPDSFMFQEGLAPLYQQAKYAVFKFDGDRDYVLVGLADDKLQMIPNVK